MDQGRGLEAMAGSLAPTVMMSETAEFSIDDGDQVFERPSVPVGPGAQQLAYVIHGVFELYPHRRSKKFRSRMSAFVGHSAPSAVGGDMKHLIFMPWSLIFLFACAAN